MTETGGEQTAAIPAGEAAVPVSPAPTTVTVRGETVTLFPRTPLALGEAAQVIFGEAGGVAVVFGRLSELYLTFGIASWTFRDAKGQVEPVNAESVARLLPFEDGGHEVAEAADLLYSTAVLSPLVKRFSAPSPTGPTEDSTPPTPGSGSTPPTPSRRSSRRGTAGKRSGGRGR